MSRDGEYAKLAKLIGDVIFMKSDVDPGRKMQNQIVERDKKYTELLDSYIHITKRRFGLKEFHKWAFFWMVMAASAVCLFMSCRVINKVLASGSAVTIAEAFPTLAAAFTAFIATVIAVPLTIAQFLFNTGEDDNITELIQHTQDHDVSGIDMLKERFSEKTAGKKQVADRSGQQLFEEVIGD